MVAAAVRALGLVALVACGSGAREAAPPPAERPQLSISVDYPGAEPDEIDRAVVQPMTMALGEIDGVQALRSVAGDGRATLVLALEPGRDLDAALGEAQRLVARIAPILPPGAVPELARGSDDAPAALWLGVLSPQLDRAALSELARDTLAPAIRRVPGVARVVAVGAVQRAVRVRLDVAKLDAYAATIGDVAAAIRGGAATVRDIGELGALAVVEPAVRLRDVAVIELGVDREPAAATPSAPSLGVHLRSGADAARVLPAVRAAVAEARDSLPAGASIAETPEPAGSGVRRRAPLEFHIIGPTWPTVADAAPQLAAALRASGVASNVTTDLAPPTASRRIVLHHDRIAELGVASADVAAIHQILHAPVARLRRANVLIELAADDPALLGALRVRSRRGALVPLSELARVEIHASVPRTRHDGSFGIAIFADLAPGHTLEAARLKIDEIARTLPAGHRIARP